MIRARLLRRGRLLRRLVVEAAGGPEEAAGDELEVGVAADGFVGVAERRDEDARALVVVGPRDDGFLGALFALRERRGLVKDLDVVVQLVLGADPVLQALGDGVI